MLRPDLGPCNRVHTLGHELGHAAHGDPAVHNPRYEARADSFAADFLIDPREYAELETIYDGQIGAIAAEMGVTVSLLATWCNHLERQTA